MTLATEAHRGAWPATAGRNMLRPILAVALVAAADTLMFDQPTGIGWFVFAALLAMTIVVVSGRGGIDRASIGRAAVPVLALAPLVENVSPVSVAVAAAGLAVFALMVAHRLRPSIAGIGRQLAGFALAAPFRLLADIVRVLRLRGRIRRLEGRWTPLLAWIVPVACSAVFVALFSAANPIIQNWLERIDLLAWLAQADIARILFWVVVACVAWAFLRPRVARLTRRRAKSPAAEKPATEIAPSKVREAVFGRAALLRALVVFNAIFAVQTALDATYLWGGVALPDGLSYAAYAHRGAYPLIATALLAAGFVLVALRPGSATSQDGLIRRLVYLWTAQNIWLVLSSMLRLDLYVGVYSLTYWRIAAFLWMGLVAVGLVTIIVRIALGKSNEWLLSANLLTLSTLLYACCFINFAALIAAFNVDHAKEMRGEGLPIDAIYLRDLGPAAFPAIDRLLAALPNERVCGYDPYVDGDFCLDEMRPRDEARFRERADNWRSWSFRDWRLMRYLDARTGVPSVPGQAAP